MPDRLSATLAFDEPASRVKLVSPARANALAGLGIESVRDLVTHFPRRYIDLSVRESTATAQIGQSCTVQGMVHEVKLKRPKPHLPLVEITLVDEAGALMITCFRQPWLADQLKSGSRIAVAGKVEFNYGFKRMTNPYLEILDGGEDEPGMVIPVHPACEKISVAWMRRIISNALSHVAGAFDPLPLELRVKYRLMSRSRALSCIHFPTSMDEVAEARRRLVYEELLLLELTLMRGSAASSAGADPVEHVTDGLAAAALEAALPFSLTDEQVAARKDILDGMAAKRRLNHMLLGDVGTGKTAVAAFALAACADSGSQAALLAPTEVLASQHADKLGRLFDEVGITWAHLSASTPDAERTRIIEGLSSGAITVLIGTHAILEDDVSFQNLTLAVIDEQQRFGVEQRAKLLGKGASPDALYLTATPIPRSLALAIYGDMTLSYIKRRPHALARRETFVHAKDDQGKAYDAAREALARGEQVYVVCPLIGQDSAARDSRAVRGRAVDEEAYEYAAISIEGDDDFLDDNVTAACEEASYLQRTVFADWNVELLHGRMKSAEKHEVMERFRTGETQVLVATTVIEVGVDVPRATVMIVQDADRFGLSQLHQLRGRVGRGGTDAQVHLISASKSEAALARLGAMVRTDDGFELAQYDLSLRREGDILGNRQHGASALKLVNIARDARIIEAAHADAAAIMEEDPGLEEPQHRALAFEALRTFGAKSKKGRWQA